VYICETKGNNMKSYTEINGEIKEVKILAESKLTVSVEASDFALGRIQAFRAKSEIFTSLTKAKKYFK